MINLNEGDLIQEGPIPAEVFEVEDAAGDRVHRGEDNVWLCWPEDACVLHSESEVLSYGPLTIVKLGPRDYYLGGGVSDWQRRAERYRLAWTNAYNRSVGRRQNFHTMLRLHAERGLELEALQAERDKAKALVRSVDMYGSGYIYRDSQGVDHHLNPAEVTVFVAPERVTVLERLTQERDEARAEVVRLGRRAEELIEEKRQAFERANEAARLSAQARDDADALNKVIADLREQVEIVESDRTANAIWALNVIAEHGIEHDTGDLLGAIRRYIRECKDDLATYRHVADRSIQAREQYAQEAERLGAQCQHLVNRANEFRAARDHLLKAGREWLDAGYPTVGEPATAGDRMASAIEDVIANVPEGQSMWAMTEHQTEALNALLRLVHYDDLARSWLAMLPAEVHPEGL